MSNTVLISGGASGIGRVIAEAYLAEGASVHVCDTSSDMIDEFVAAHPSATATQADVTSAREVDRVFDDFRARYSELNILVNNAGISGPIAHVEDIEP